MRCITLLTFLMLAILAISAEAGKVTINGACIDCNRPDAPTTTTRRPTSANSGRRRGRPTTPKPKNTKTKDDSDEDDWGNFNLFQDERGGQHITAARRHKRQWGHRQVIITDPGTGIGGGGGGWSGHVTTIDSRGRPGTVLHNDDCVGCNING
ncbi:bomanin Bicipital 1 [Drosophila grimshawi]|uniref:GH20221 n=1 Tax=Drosophila grimshawi TaxID=7222 RepID=B4J5S2_DROGR|nr:bomanin Bicipital 1 [Drosophila grimshawi]EDW01848.1 GH20221 [Drosophila grimshawi]